MWTFLKKLMRILPDWLYISLKYYYHFKRFPDLRNPKTFNEKLQWLKLYDRKPVYTTMVDKYEAKKYVAEKIGEEYIVPTYGVWERFDDIDFESLPEQFVLKCTHDCGGLVIVKDKDQLDVAAAKTKIEGSLKTNYFWEGREWPYKNVKPRIIAEKYLSDEKKGDLPDYKFFAFGGKVKIMFVTTERQGGDEPKFDFFDENFQHLPVRNSHPNAEKQPEKPQNFELMKTLAEKLSEDIPVLRVDFYEVEGKVYFGELTFFSRSGLVPFRPPEWDKKLGDWISLPEKTVRS